MKPYKHPTGRWTYEFVVKGQRFQKSGFSTPKEAKDAGEKAKRKVEQLLTIDVGFEKLCSERLDDLEAKRSTHHYNENFQLIKKLQARWKEKKEVTRDDVDKYLRWAATPKDVTIVNKNNKNKDKKPYTVTSGSNSLANRELRLIKALFSFGVKRGLVDGNPAKWVERYPEKRRRKYIPSVKDVTKVLEVCDQEQRTYLLFIINTMARVREINNLTWDDIEDGHLVLRTSKSKDSDEVERFIPINQTLKDILASLPREGTHIFVNPQTKKQYDYRKRMMKTLCKKADVRHFTFHCLRHLGASRLMKGGVALTDIQKLLGHQRSTTTDIYLHSIGNGLEKAMSQLEVK